MGREGPSANTPCLHSNPGSNGLEQSLAGPVIGCRLTVFISVAQFCSCRYLLVRNSFGESAIFRSHSVRHFGLQDTWREWPAISANFF